MGDIWRLGLVTLLLDCGAYLFKNKIKVLYNIESFINSSDLFEINLLFLFTQLIY